MTLLFGLTIPHRPIWSYEASMYRLTDWPCCLDFAAVSVVQVQVLLSGSVIEVTSPGCDGSPYVIVS